MYSRDLNFVRRSSLSVLWKAGNDVTTEPSKETNAIFHSIMIILFFLLLLLLHFLGIFFVCCCRCHTLPLSLHFPLAFLSRLSSEMSSRRKNQQTNNLKKKKKSAILFDRRVLLLLPTAPTFSHPFLIYIKY